MSNDQGSGAHAYRADSMAAAGVGGRPGVLIVEDNEAIARGLAQLLGDAGFEVTTFHRGHAAIEHPAARAPAGLPAAAAAVIDIHLPDISGLILSQRLRELLGPRAPIIVLSGDGSMEVLNSLAHVGATCFFRKPVSAPALVKRLKELL